MTKDFGARTLRTIVAVLIIMLAGCGTPPTPTSASEGARQVRSKNASPATASRFWGDPKVLQEAFPISAVDERPKIIVMAPEKPSMELFRRLAQQSTPRKCSCNLKLVIGSEGLVKFAEVLSTDDAEWALHALRAQKDARYQPARKDGVPVACVWETPVVFEVR